MWRLLEISPRVASRLVSASFMWGAACLILNHRSIPQTMGVNRFGTIIKRVLDSVHFGLSLVVNPTKNKSEQGVGDNWRGRPPLFFGA